MRIQHMLDAGREAIEFCSGRTRADLEADRMLARAVVKAIEIVGEAAGKVSAPTREKLPDVPWQNIVGMRHRLTHTYFSIDYDVVWNTVRVDLPPLVATLEGWLQEDKG